MARRKLRKKRVAAALLILILLIGGICFLVFRGCSRDDSSQNNGGTTGADSNNSGSQTETTNGGTVSTGGNSSNETTAQTTQALTWPLELSNYIKEYNGAGEMVSASSTKDEQGKSVYKVQYKGTTIDSCFAYAKETLEINADWTEEVTGELYTLSRDMSGFTLSLRCEPKAQNGYDLQIEVKIK